LWEPVSEVERSDELADQVIEASKVTDNTKQEVIRVTRDKVELALHRNLPKYIPTGQLIASVGLLLALIATLITAEFQLTFGIPSDMWRGFFLLACLVALILVVRDAYRWAKRPKLDDLVDAIEKDTR
jgi:hypothetical protein